jgi:hypothetical protein
MATLVDGTTVCRWCVTEGQGDLCPSHQTLSDSTRHARCNACGGTFTQAAWEDRHSGPDGEDIHAGCCAHCGDAIAWYVIDVYHPDLTVTFDDEDEACAYALVNGSLDVRPIHDRDLYLMMKEG